MHTGGAELHPTARLAVVHPEGHVDALDLLQMVGLREGGRQQRLFAIVFLQRLDGVVLIELEWKDEVRLQHTGELPRHHGGVSAVRAGRGCRGGVADQLCTARRAGICLHALCIRTPVITQGRRPRLRRPFFLLPPPLLLPPAFPLPSSPPQPPSPLFPRKAPRSPRHQSLNRNTRTPAVRSCPQSGAVRYRRDIDNLLPVLPSQIPRFLCRRSCCRGDDNRNAEANMVGRLTGHTLFLMKNLVPGSDRSFCFFVCDGHICRRMVSVHQHKLREFFPFLAGLVKIPRFAR